MIHFSFIYALSWLKMLVGETAYCRDACDFQGTFLFYTLLLASVLSYSREPCIGGKKSFSFTMTVLIVFTSFCVFSVCFHLPFPIVILPINLLPTPCYKMGFLITCVKVYIPRRITIMELASLCDKCSMFYL